MPGITKKAAVRRKQWIFIVFFGWQLRLKVKSGLFFLYTHIFKNVTSNMASCHSVTWRLLTFHREDVFFVAWIFWLPKVPPPGGSTQSKGSFYHLHGGLYWYSEVCSRAAGKLTVDVKR